MLYDCDVMRPTALREVVCGVLRTAPSPGNWSDFPNVAQEVDALLSDCEWYEVYDIIEAIHARLE
jgi:hypothetical protein